MRRMSVLLAVVALLALVVVPSYSQDGGGPANLLQYGNSNMAGERQPVGEMPEFDLLLDQQPNAVNGIFSDVGCDLCGGPQVIADNFQFAEPVTINEIVFWTGYYPTDVPIDPDTIRVIFHADSAGLPGAVVYDEYPVSYTRFQTGVVLFGVHEWQHTLTLAEPVTLDPGMYWLEIYNDTGFGTDDFFWETGNLDPNVGVADAAWALEAPGQSWIWPLGYDMSFQLWGSIGGGDLVFATHVRIIPLGASPLLLGIVRAATGDGSTPVPGATVSVDWTIPPAGGYVIPQTRTTNGNGLAFPVMIRHWTGTYVLELTNIDAPGYTYDPNSNWEDTAVYVNP